MIEVEENTSPQISRIKEVNMPKFTAQQLKEMK